MPVTAAVAPHTVLLHSKLLKINHKRLLSIVCVQQVTTRQHQCMQMAKTSNKIEHNTTYTTLISAVAPTALPALAEQPPHFSSTTVPTVGYCCWQSDRVCDSNHTQPDPVLLCTTAACYAAQGSPAESWCIPSTPPPPSPLHCTAACPKCPNNNTGTNIVFIIKSTTLQTQLPHPELCGSARATRQQSWYQPGITSTAWRCYIGNATTVMLQATATSLAIKPSAALAVDQAGFSIYKDTR